MMKLYDAGGCDDGTLVCYRCKQCGHDTGWVVDDRSTSEIWRGLPCPRCNDSEGAEAAA